MGEEWGRGVFLVPVAWGGWLVSFEVWASLEEWGSGVDTER